jgi:hypothetical protein
MRRAALGDGLTAGERADMEDKPREWKRFTRFGGVVVRTARELRDALDGRVTAASIRTIAESSSVIIGRGSRRNAGETTVQDNHLLPA